MKRFIDKNGTFEIKIPVTWRHSIIDGKIHTFQEYEIWKSDTFQLSIMNIQGETEVDNFSKMTRDLSVSKIGGHEYFRLLDLSNENFITKSWIKLFGNKVITFTFTYLNNKKDGSDDKVMQEKIVVVNSIIEGFRLIDESKSASELNSYRFDMFLQGVGATSLILNKAIENKAFIEATCIIANQMDALLRTGIILKKQIADKDRNIELEWIYQGLDDKRKSEKDVFGEALKLGVIGQDVFDELYELYEDRNRVVHRFIISEITLAEVEEIAFRYYLKREAINKIIYDLESEQIRLGVGMTTNKGGGTEKHNYLDYIKGKIGKLDYFEDLNATHLNKEMKNH